MASTLRANARLVFLCALVAALLAMLPSAASAKRFDGYTKGFIGRGHSFVVGDGFSLVFIDQRRTFTPNRVCWHRLHHSNHRCWFDETGRRGHSDEIFTPAPSFVGTYIVKWTVRHHRKARWRFYNGIDD